MSNILEELRKDYFDYEPSEVDKNLIKIEDSGLNDITDLFFFNEKILYGLASVCNLNIITDQEVSLDILNKIKSKVNALTILASDKISIKYLEDAKTLGVKLILIANDDIEWGRLAEKFFDFELDKEDTFGKKYIENSYQINEQ